MLISAIIPARNESARIASQIAYLQALPRARKTGLEIIVCDGQSDDGTIEIARECGARTIQTIANRGLQQNAGARISKGEFFWFLHADARPHLRSLEYFERIQNDNRKISGGNFQLRFDEDIFATRFIESIARVQRRRGVYYGDSGIWARREVFNLLDGFQSWPLFEDLDFARRLEFFSRANGMKTEYSRSPITVSSRRLKDRPSGVLLQWMKLQFLFSIGVSPEKLARSYFSHRSDEKSADANMAQGKLNKSESPPRPTP